MNELILCGFYGMRNTGDDCFCEVAGWGAREIWGKSKICYLSSSLPTLSFDAKKLFVKNGLLRKFNKILLIYHVVSKPYLVFAGGSIFHGHEGWEREYISRLCKIKKINMGGIGVSLGPYRNKIEQLKTYSFLKRLSFLTLRDERSYEESLTLELPYKPVLAWDLAGMLPEISNGSNDSEKIRTAGKILGIVPCCYKQGSDNNHLHNEVKAIVRVLEKISYEIQFRVKLFVFNSHQHYGDIAIVKSYCKLLNGVCDVEVNNYSSAPLFVWKEISKCDAVISTRLHGGIFACMAKVPFLQREYHQKCSDFMRDVNAPKEWRLDKFEIDTAGLYSKIINILTWEKCYPIDVKKLSAKSSLNFTEVSF